MKLKSKLLDSSGELADTASTLKGSLDAAKEMIGKVPAMTPTNYAQLYYSSELMDYQADAIALQGDSGTGIPGADAYQACGQHPRALTAAPRAP